MYLLLFIILLRYYYKMWSGPKVKQLLHLASALYTSALEKRDHSAIGMGDILSMIQELIGLS